MMESKHISSDATPSNRSRRKKIKTSRSEPKHFKTVEECEPEIQESRKAYEYFRSKYHGWKVRGSLKKFLDLMLHLEQGSRVDIRTPLWKGMTRDQVVKSWDKVLGDAKSVLRRTFASNPEGADELAVNEESNRGTIGEQSTFLPASVDVKERVFEYYDVSGPTSSFNRRAWEEALEHTANMFKAGSLGTLELDQVKPDGSGDNKDRLAPEKNSGLWACTSDWYIPKSSPKYPNRDEFHIEVQQAIEQETKAFVEECDSARDWRDAVRTVGYVIGQRLVQVGPDHYKRNASGTMKYKRYIWMAPKWQAWAMKCVSHPMQLAMARYVEPAFDDLPVFLGWLPMPNRDKCIQRALSLIDKKGHIPLGGDFSSFDQHVHPDLQWDVTVAGSNWLDDRGKRRLLAGEYSDIYKGYVIFPGGYHDVGPAGIHSGSNLTSNKGSMFNITAQWYGKFAGFYDLDYVSCMGDDFFGGGDGYTPDNVAAAMGSLGMVLKPEQQTYKKGTVEYLQHRHILGAPGGIYSSYRVIGKSMANETDVSIKGDEWGNPWVYIFQARARGNNAMFHPMAEQLWQFMAKGDKQYHLGTGVDADKIARLAGGYAERRLTQQNYSPSADLLTAGLPWRKFPINRVLSDGERLPPAGDERRWEFIYSTKWADLPLLPTAS